MKNNYWTHGCDIIHGPEACGVKIATATLPKIALSICSLLNMLSGTRFIAVQDTLDERDRQDKKWGEQNHDPITWSAILTEECGEFAQAALQSRFGGPAAAGLRDEAIQCAAVALQIVECIDRNAQPAAISADSNSTEQP